PPGLGTLEALRRAARRPVRPAARRLTGRPCRGGGAAARPRGPTFPRPRVKPGTPEVSSCRCPGSGPPGANGSSAPPSSGTAGCDGTGQTIAIVDAYDDPAFLNSTDPNYADSDLAQFDLQLEIPDPPSFIKLNQQGQTSPLPRTDPSGAGNPNGNWEIEEALD